MAVDLAVCLFIASAVVSATDGQRGPDRSGQAVHRLNELSSTKCS